MLFFVSLCLKPILWALWRHPSKQLFVRACILCAYGSFLFGWHVHEKAIVMVLLPITPFAFCSPTLARVFLMIVIPATFAQFPLLHQAAETPTKLLLLTSFSLYALYALKQHFNLSRVLHRIEYAYLFGLVLLQCMHSFGEPLIGLHTRMPFLTLMSTSVYTSLAIIYTWIMFYLDSMSFARC